ncbi:GNAT family N-acetyltransferase [candidate division KSB1 bacterium]|nr:GNAT family N-acetyltransferase [candidate division KSB1 bacterium]
MAELTGRQTALEWNVSTSRIAVLPVGSFEQHAHHLPLDTDILLADYFAARLADYSNAALLPVLPFGTCSEQIGFRGSVGLRPETVMAVVRDICDQVEQQNFSLLILVNMHGGNFSLAPVVRDFNRSDRALKVLLCYPPELVEAIDGDLHAGEWETSLMLALFPERVGSERIDVDDPRWLQGEFLRSDLNHWGVGAISPRGALGFPSRASVEKGKRIAAELKTAMCRWFDQRLEWLEQSRTYAGQAGLSLRRLSAEDLPAALRLSRAVGWNQIQQDWQAFLQFRPAGCFAALIRGKVVGTATTIDYQGQTGWIGMVLVDSEYRRRGIGKYLLQAALESLQHCRRIKLDATADGQPLYERLGFKPECRLLRLRRPHTAVACAVHQEPHTRTVTPPDLETLVAYDTPRFGVQRGAVLQNWFERCPRCAVMVEKKGRIRGYSLARPGRTAVHIGPLVADSLSCAKSLLTALVCRFPGQDVIVDSLHADNSWIDLLQELGFEQSRIFMRMYLGADAGAGDVACQYAQSGPELG